MTPLADWPLARWADRRPTVRYPLLLIALLLLWGLAGALEHADDATPTHQETTCAGCL